MRLAQVRQRRRIAFLDGTLQLVAQTRGELSVLDSLLIQKVPSITAGSGAERKDRPDIEAARAGPDQ